MAKRVHHILPDADSFSGCLPAACIDWRISDADTMSARRTPGVDFNRRLYDCRRIPHSQTIDQFLVLVGESIYEALGLTRRTLG